MANTLLRTGRSGVLNTGRDFSCCIVTADHELVTAAECYPIHVLRGADLMSRAMKELHPDLKHGDAFLHNSPYHGNSHAADHTILVPVCDDSGTHQYTVLVKAHQADCGNSLATTYMGAARDVYNEGALIFPAVRIQQDFRDTWWMLRPGIKPRWMNLTHLARRIARRALDVLRGHRIRVRVARFADVVQPDFHFRNTRIRSTASIRFSSEFAMENRR